MTASTSPALSPVESCRVLLARVYAAAGDRAALAAVYADTIGHDPFADDPTASTADVLETLEGFVREWAAALGVHWSLVDPRVFVVEGDDWPRSAASMLAANVDAPEVCDWVCVAQPGDMLQGSVSVVCVVVSRVAAAV